MADNARRQGSHFSGQAQPRRGSEPFRRERPRPTSSGRTSVRGEAQGQPKRARYQGRVSERTARATQSAHHRTPGESHERRTRHRWVGVVLVVVALVAVGGVGLLAYRHFFGSRQDDTQQVQSGQQVSVTIPEGSDASSIAKILMDAGVISDSSAFFKEVQSQQAESSMKSGSYDLMTGANLSELVRQLVAGPNSTSKRITLAEGLTVTQTASKVEGTLGISSDDFTNQAKASNYVGDYAFLSGAGNDSLEGFLYGSTYDFGDTEISADAVIRAMLDQYQANVASLDFATAEASIKEKYGVTVSDYDILTIASIIEREALTDDDRAKIASVLYNRLKAGMALQSDATMGYVTGGSVTADDLKTESPYNTYLNKGLPPTPICSPSLASIKAALAPADTNYYYFWITESEHVFSETYEEHQKAIANATQ
ncbi:endolytic transglycosylase MltG [Olsenella porci]|uniref:Endolytic murein transglycosylase n=1 Tax=Olsenella porci TaxID=2652279 RepID=A0A6N7XT22_9ACTN|nr:endolytic transglycosylase MltG [Olsenella porci]MST73069.1 endolytic transglycosylase MltG [Olsenella porci]